MRPHTELDREAVRRGHRMHVTVDLWTPSGKVATLPVVTGEVSWTLSAANGMRSGKVSLPGYEWLNVISPGKSPWLNIVVGIEGSTWNLGQFWITRMSVTRPGGLVELDLGDWSLKRSIPHCEADITVGGPGQTLAAMVKQWMDGVLPPTTCTRDDSGGAVGAGPVKVALGGNIWAQGLVAVCEQVGDGYTPVLTSRQTFEIRDFDRSPYTDRVENIDGTVIKETMVMDSMASANKVIASVRDDNPDSPEVAPEVMVLDTGPFRYDVNGFGATATVVSKSVPYATPEAARALASRTYIRELGLVQTYSLDTIPMPWIEPGDRLRWKPSFGEDPNQEFTGAVDSVRFPLTPSGSMHIAMRMQVDKT